MVGHALMDGANQVRARVGKFEAEAGPGVSLGARGFFHPLASLMRMTSSPAAGLLVVPFVTVPLKVCAEATEPSRIGRAQLQ